MTTKLSLTTVVLIAFAVVLAVVFSVVLPKAEAALEDTCVDLPRLTVPPDPNFGRNTGETIAAACAHVHAL